MGSVERLDVGQLVVCLMSGLGNFPDRSVVNLAQVPQSGRIQFFRICSRIWFRNSLLARICCLQPFFVFCNGLVPGSLGEQSQWGEGEVQAVEWAKYANQDDLGLRLSWGGMVFFIGSLPCLAVFALPRLGGWFLGSAQAVVGWYFTLLLCAVA